MKNEKKDNQEILKQVRELKHQRPTYGYKRVTAMLNKNRAIEGEARVNRKRIYRLMRNEDLLIRRYPKRDRHPSSGKVMTLHSNTRWCSDAFEIMCFNGEKVYVVFSLDCRDREIIHFIAKKEPILAEDICELMTTSVVKRFDDFKTPQKIQWLSDRGTVYRALSTRNRARQLGLITCYTAPYSPSSNGMAEALVHTIKRDYVYLADCESAKKVINMLPEWIEDYNNQAPHSALSMMSPREFKKFNRSV